MPTLDATAVLNEAGQKVCAFSNLISTHQDRMQYVGFMVGKEKIYQSYQNHANVLQVFKLSML